MIRILGYLHTNLKVRSTVVIFCILFGFAACSNESIQTPIPVETEASPLDLTQESQQLDNSASTPGIQPLYHSLPMEIEPEDLKGVNLRFWHPWTQEVAVVIDSLVDQFNAENPYDIMVNTNPQGDRLYQNVIEGLRTGIFPDIAVGRNFQIQAWDDHREIVVDLNTYVFNPEWGLSTAEISDFYTPRWNQDIVKGKRLGIPAQTSAAVLFYNQSWARELGFEMPPTTTDEFKDQACAAAAHSVTSALSGDSAETGIGGWIISTDPATIMAWIMAFEGDGIDNNGDGYAFDTTEAEDAFAFIKGMFRSGCAWIPESRYSNNEFATRKGLFYSSDISAIPFQLSAFESYSSDDDWIPIAYPGKMGIPVINLYGTSFAILESTPEVQLASWLFIKWMTQPENQVPFIEASGYFPTRSSTMNLMEDYSQNNPQWTTVQDLLLYSEVEPNLGSWEIARWAIGDAAIELISPDFPSDHIPLLLKDLDALLDEIQNLNR